MKGISKGNNRFDFRRLWLAVVLGSFVAIGPLSMDMYLPALPVLTADIGGTTSLVQLSITACLLGMAMGQLLIGAISDQKGRKRPLIISLAVYSISSLLCAFAPSIEILLLLRFVQGVSGAGGIVIARAIVRDLFSGVELTRFFALLMLVNGAAPILSPVIGGVILNFTSWRGVFIILCILGALMVAAACFGVKESLSPSNRSSGGIKNTFIVFRHLLGDRMFMGYALAQGFVSAAMFGYIAGSPFVIQNIYGASPQMFSFIFALNGVGIIIASQVTGRLAGKVKEEKMLIIGLCMALLGGISLIAMIVFQAGLISVLIPLFFVVSSVGIVGTTTFALAMQNQRKSAGSAAALLGLIPFLLGSITAPLTGIGGEQSAIPMGIVIVGCQMFAMLAYFLMTQRRSVKKGLVKSANF
ncbi:multidrug effflux MFS transporter [Bacillus sp. FJAT-50079]|uniref:multidrug effflux MFS transporter n=1 Tax=Bacillus sp. FJAT-50079 TaxID=2833577 RepID=UPI001BC8DC47|nr:multidrug effflux MFS transporter [Bacillus sp. FJAT-50079]MBS4208004.1 multidrug effflux MFS transporter [Bacillus sp. FJAT-50079]